MDLLHSGHSKRRNLKVRYAFLLFLNIFDGLATCLGMSLGILSEANPLLSGFGPYQILLIKLVGISFLILVLFNNRESRVSQTGTLIAIGVYVHIFLLHVAWML